mmetsp:Transcript_6826/g.13249  ORF Transcript_6826/g.13249 Transcript_6826/m.13249 type:complete len:175 (+) Transcript_6826:85-609(+)
MTTLRPFTLDDLLSFNPVNLDPLTETYNLSFYLTYLARWPSYFVSAVSPRGKVQGYCMGKCEGEADLWHGHVTAVTVGPEYRRQGLAGVLMGGLEATTEGVKGYFVDLFVRASNGVAIGMYERMGYTKYRRVLGYYSGREEEDAWDMRKPMSRDKEGKSAVPLGRDIRPEELEW